VATKLSRFDQDSDGPVINWPRGSLILDYGSANPNPDPQEIFTDPQHLIEIVKLKDITKLLKNL
jgi:hypothetical protein